MKYILILAIAAFALPVNAQTVNVVKHSNTPLNVKAIDVEPQFPGGTKEFNKYLSKNVVYPANASAKEMNGAVTLTMAIQKNGSIADVKIVNGLSDLMDKETIRLMNSSPRWTPGMQHGQPVVVRYTFTINYAYVGKKK